MNNFEVDPGTSRHYGKHEYRMIWFLKKAYVGIYEKVLVRLFLNKLYLRLAHHDVLSYLSTLDHPLQLTLVELLINGLSRDDLPEVVEYLKSIISADPSIEKWVLKELSSALSKQSTVFPPPDLVKLVSLIFRQGPDQAKRLMKEHKADLNGLLKQLLTVG